MRWTPISVLALASLGGEEHYLQLCSAMGDAYVCFHTWVSQGERGRDGEAGEEGILKMHKPLNFNGGSSLNIVSF